MKKTYILMIFLTALLTITGCTKKSNSFTGETYDSGKQIVEEAVDRIEKKYEITSGEITVEDYEFNGSGGPFGSSSAITPVYITMQDAAGKKFHAFYNAGAPDPIVYDDYQYEEILADFQEKFADDLNGTERVSIQYCSQGMRHNLLSEKEYYQGDLSLIQLEKVRLEYIDANLFDYEFEEFSYLLISYDSKADMEMWFKESWWNIPQYPVCGVQAMRTEDSYREYYSKKYGDYFVVGTAPLTIEPCVNDFDITNLIGHGARNPEAVSDAIHVITEEKYTVYYKAENGLATLEKYGLQPEGPLEENINIPVYLGHVYDYQNHDDYNKSNCRYLNGYFYVSNVSPKYKAILFYIDKD